MVKRRSLVSQKQLINVISFIFQEKLEEPIVFNVVDEDEYTVEYIDESELILPSSQNITPSSSAVQTENEEEEDSDEENKPPTPKSCRNRRHSNVSEGKRKGRPPKPLRKTINPKELANLPPEAKLYKVRRFKNNEASRRSRFNRRQKDLKLGEQCELFEEENVDLRRVLKAHKRLHKKLRALIINIKISV